MTQIDCENNEWIPTANQIKELLQNKYNLNIYDLNFLELEEKINAERKLEKQINRIKPRSFYSTSFHVLTVNEDDEECYYKISIVRVHNDPESFSAFVMVDKEENYGN